MSQARLRYIDYWLQYCKKHQSEWPLLVDEYGQLQRAWSMLVSLEELDMEPEAREQVILDYIFTLDSFLERRGLLGDNINWIERGLEAAHFLKRFDLLGRLGQDLGWCYRMLGQPQRALEYLELALAVRQRHGPHIGEAATLNMMGVVYDDLGAYQQAIDYLQKALVIRREVEHRAGEAITLHNIASTYFNAGQWTEAETFYNSSLELARELNDEAGIAGTLNNLGELKMLQGEVEQATRTFMESLTIYEQMGDQVHVADVYNNLGMLAGYQGKPRQAIEWLEKSLAYQREFHLDTAVTLNNLGTIYETLGEFQRALTYFEHLV